MKLRPRCLARGPLGVCDLPDGHPGMCMETSIDNPYERIQRPIQPTKETP